jgi:hypothetical protein
MWTSEASEASRLRYIGSITSWTSGIKAREISQSSPVNVGYNTTLGELGELGTLGSIFLIPIPSFPRTVPAAPVECLECI